MTCPLCRAERLTEWLYEDDVCYVCRCLTHRDKWLIVLKRHTANPTDDELTHMRRIAEKLFCDKKWRTPYSMPEHFHLHES